MEFDIYAPSSDGYEIVHRFNNWRVAYLSYAERFDNITYLEKHLKTDEIFVLLKGSAMLLVGKKAEHIEMEKGKMYNVKKGVWHNIKVSKDAVLLIVENNDTCKDNTEYTSINPKDNRG